MSNLPTMQSEILHITTDAVTAEHLENSLSTGMFLAWQDALYEGPIDSQSNLTQLSRVRAKYFADVGWINEDEVIARYQSRNKVLFAYQQFKEVVLWFDHDLNSQLQLVQIVDWFSHHKMDNTILSLVAVERLPGISSSLNLPMIGSQIIHSLMKKRSEVTMGQMNLCQQAWKALGSYNPNMLLRLYNLNTSTMPFLKNAILRFLKQFPSQANGLSQSETHIANILLHHHHDASEIYLAMQSKEGIPFMNRAIFACYLQNMSNGKVPIIKQKIFPHENAIEEDEGEYEEVLVEQNVVLQLTDAGRQVLHNWVDWIQINSINRWLGGVQLSEGNLWRYDQNKRKLIKTYV